MRSLQRLADFLLSGRTFHVGGPLSTKSLSSAWNLLPAS